MKRYVVFGEVAGAILGSQDSTLGRTARLYHRMLDNADKKPLDTWEQGYFSGI